MVEVLDRIAGMCVAPEEGNARSVSEAGSSEFSFFGPREWTTFCRARIYLFGDLSRPLPTPRHPSGEASVTLGSRVWRAALSGDTYSMATNMPQNPLVIFPPLAANEHSCQAGKSFRRKRLGSQPSTVCA